MAAAGATMPAPRALTRETLAAGVRFLARRDRDFAALYRRNGLPPMWARRPGFPTLVHIVLEQQVSIAAARSLYRRVNSEIGGMTPERVLERGVPGLHRLGITRQKASYCHALAQAVVDGSLSLGGIARAEDGAGRSALLRLRGIGPWSADIY
jgi:DNA-3-methyladenine glycosylase II